MSLNNFVYDPTSKYLFNRSYSLSIGPTGQSAAVQYGTMGLKPAPLRVQFDLDKNTIGSNQAKVTIYNLAQKSRQQFQKGYSIQLQAGYKDIVDTIFVGDIIKAFTKRDGADFITSFDLVDGGQAITRAVFDRSYPAGTQLTQILQDVAQAMGLDAGVAVGIPQKTYNNGFTTSGTCADAMTKLTRGQNLEWSVQNGRINIVPLQSSTGDTAVLISKETGMIGVPSKGNGFTQFTSLLNPRIVPQAFVQIVSDDTSVNGFYKLRRCHYEGDTHENKWQVSCEAVQIQAQLAQALPAANGFNYTGAQIA